MDRKSRRLVQQLFNLESRVVHSEPVIPIAPIGAES